MSMTPYEREHPEVLRGTRIDRIAKGSGTTRQDVNRLLKQFDQIRKMMKAVTNMGSNPARMKAQLQQAQMMARKRR